MTYSITDWSQADRNQYFNGAYVEVVTDNIARILQIDGFDNNNDSVHVTDGNGYRTLVPISDVRWTGLTPRRCVARNNTLYFIAPLGSRTTRKPVTRGNLCMITIGPDGRRGLSNREPQRTVIELYLSAHAYPTSRDQRIFELQHNMAVALGPTAGVIQVTRYEESEDEDGEYYEHREVKYCVYQDSVKVYDTDELDDVINHIQENEELYCE